MKRVSPSVSVSRCIGRVDWPQVTAGSSATNLELSCGWPWLLAQVADRLECRVFGVSHDLEQHAAGVLRAAITQCHRSRACAHAGRRVREAMVAHTARCDRHRNTALRRGALLSRARWWVAAKCTSAHLSVVVRTTPMLSIRRNATSRSASRWLATASTAKCTAIPFSKRSMAVCSTQTCACWMGRCVCPMDGAHGGRNPTINCHCSGHGTYLDSKQDCRLGLLHFKHFGNLLPLHHGSKPCISSFAQPGRATRIWAGAHLRSAHGK